MEKKARQFANEVKELGAQKHKHMLAKYDHFISKRN